MAAIKPFRFLSLPKELRLMVYEFIAAKKTHHRIRLGKPDEHHDLKYVRTTLSGIEILATCHQIYEEAIDIMRCRLAAIKTSPLRIISTNHMHGLPDFNVIAMLDRVDATRLNCGNIRALPVAPAEELAARAEKLALCEKEPYDCRYAPSHILHIFSMSVLRSVEPIRDGHLPYIRASINSIAHCALWMRMDIAVKDGA
jgi:hypothetical protein